MLDFLACHSIEKLVIDAEAIASAQRLIQGIEPGAESLAVAMFAQTGLQGDFLKLKETRALFRREQHFPSSVIDRGAGGVASDLVGRGRERVKELLTEYRHPEKSSDRERDILAFAQHEATKVGLKELPGVTDNRCVFAEQGAGQV